MSSKPLYAKQQFKHAGKDYAPGDVLDDIPAGTIKSLVGVGWASTQPPAEPFAEPDPEPVNDGRQAITREDALAMPVAALEIDDAAKAALNKAGLTTLADLLQFGADNDGDLTQIAGIGDKLAAQIKTAVSSL